MTIGFETGRIDLWPIATAINLGLLAKVYMRSRNIVETMACAAFFWYLTAAVDLVFFPVEVSGPFVDASRHMPFSNSINLNPFFMNSAALTNADMMGLLQNTLLTIPFGLGINFTRARIKPRHYLAVAIALGVGIEATQLAISLGLGYAYRIIDINDALANCAGGIVGFGLFWVFTKVIQQFDSRFSPSGNGILNYIRQVSHVAHETRPMDTQEGVARIAIRK